MLNSDQTDRLLNFIRTRIPDSELRNFFVQNGMEWDGTNDFPGKESCERIELSVVIPVYNEEENIASLVERLVKTLAEIPCRYEIVFIDDGSKDGSVRRILEMQEKFPVIVLLRLSRNFGQHNAAQAGFDYCRGDAVIWMDADLQEPPEEIPGLWKKYKEGYDIVYTIREFNPRSSTFLKRISSIVFKKIFNRLIENPLPGNISAMRIMSRRYLENIKQLPERIRFMDGIFSWMGFKSAYVPMKYEYRYSGTSNYNFLKRIKMSADAIFSFSIVPLRLIAGIGAGITLVSLFYMLYAATGRLFGFIKVTLEWASVVASVYFLGGLQCVFMGLLGEYLGRIFIEVKARPLYIVADVYRAPE
jgi:glycosyltransferase involved in cell wall biosynthesis